MKRLLIGLFSACFIAVAIAACGESHYGFHHRGGGPAPRCGLYDSCGACTPVLGCGWCATGPTTGLCVDDPSDCPAKASTGWTWEPTGCFTLNDASVATDANADAYGNHDGEGDVIPLPVDASSSTDAGDASPDASDAGDAAG